ncbi:iron chelate uptake ABC transporter family permease subunit [Wenxinia saemankumensis]|uniref:Iron complex transport system permease protein n=1 Tax=Wenxinia saemankumensis TaxID=1447782 RepID=A0A1M6AC77_9RHOB|nr:iron chelate uptake ABC transporter family permease subunit [Wenxinia saemankumensis]SHI34037.1 iron complex transport system permease protein [Wenxinia saemankumensis]
MAERRRILFLLLGLAVLAALFMAWRLGAPYGYIIRIRGIRLGALIATGAAVGAATVLFQAVTRNRLLTPGIVGFDALFVFVQTGLVFALGATSVAGLPPMAKFLAEAAVMAAAATGLFGLLLRRGAEDLLRMVLTGVILGVFLRGLSGLAARMLEPSEYAVVQQASAASFGAVDPAQLAIAGIVLLPVLGIALRLAPALDAAALGRTGARAVGMDYDRLVLGTLLLVAALVAVSTALVGPVTFLGLIAASLAQAVLPAQRHAALIPAAALIGAAILVAGQFVFERVLGLQSTLAVIVEFVGGLLFLFLVLRRSRP